MRAHEVAHARIDFGFETTSAEHAIMADARLNVVLAHSLGNAAADVVRGLRLSDAGNVVVLAFDREQRGLRNGAWADQSPAMFEYAIRDRVLLKHLDQRLHVEF